MFVWRMINQAFFSLPQHCIWKVSFSEVFPTSKLFFFGYLISLALFSFLQLDLLISKLQFCNKPTDKQLVWNFTNGLNVIHEAKMCFMRSNKAKKNLLSTLSFLTFDKWPSFFLRLHENQLVIWFEMGKN